MWTNYTDNLDEHALFVYCCFSDIHIYGRSSQHFVLALNQRCLSPLGVAKIINIAFQTMAHSTDTRAMQASHRFTISIIIVFIL